MKDFQTAEIPQNGGEWIRPSAAREKAGKIVIWVTFIIATIFFIGVGIFCFVLLEGEKANPKAAVFFFMPVVFWILIRMDNSPQVRGVRFVRGDALQVESDDGFTVTISYEKLAAHSKAFVRLRENGRYFSPRIRGSYIVWRGGPELALHTVWRLGLSGKSYYNDG